MSYKDKGIEYTNQNLPETPKGHYFEEARTDLGYRDISSSLTFLHLKKGLASLTSLFKMFLEVYLLQSNRLRNSSAALLFSVGIDQDIVQSKNANVLRLIFLELLFDKNYSQPQQESAHI